MLVINLFGVRDSGKKNQMLLQVFLFGRAASGALHDTSAARPVCPWCSQCAEIHFQEARPGCLTFVFF